jgi:hypothetical protein
MKKISLLPVLFFSMVAFSQSSDELTIRKVLDNQIKAWNKGDIGGFMQGYWKNDSKKALFGDGKPLSRITKKIILIRLPWANCHLILSL